MATTTRYHLLPDENRPSEDENAAENERLLTPSIHDDHTLQKKRFHVSGHFTLYTRLVVICLLMPAFIVLAISGVSQTVPVAVFGMICIIRNVQVLLSQIMTPCIRIRIEVVGRSVALPIKEKQRSWLSYRSVQIVIDVVLWILLFIPATVIGSRLSRCQYMRGPWYVCNNTAFVPGMVLTWVACAFYLLSIIDGGMPGSVTILAGLDYDEEIASADDLPAVEARGGLAFSTESRKSRADSPTAV